MSDLEGLVVSISDSLGELSKLLEEVANRPQTPGKDALFDSILAEREKLVSFLGVVNTWRAQVSSFSPHADA